MANIDRETLKASLKDEADRAATTIETDGAIGYGFSEESSTKLYQELVEIDAVDALMKVAEARPEYTYTKRDRIRTAAVIAVSDFVRAIG